MNARMSLRPLVAGDAHGALTPNQRIAIDQCLDRALTAVPALLAGDMNKAMLQIHTSVPPRPKLAKPVENAAPSAPPESAA